MSNLLARRSLLLALALLALTAAPRTSQATSAEGYWSELSFTPREGQSAVVDPVRRRIVVFGGTDASGIRDDVWALPLDGPARWTRIAPLGTPPPARSEHSAIYDPVNDRMVVFGGKGALGFLSDTWALSLHGPQSWTQLAPAGTLPTGRRGHSAVYDSRRQAMVVYGGVDGLALKSTIYLMSFTGPLRWSEKALPVAGPKARRNHVAAYDVVTDRLVISGGYAVGDSSDTWALPLEGQPIWTRLATAGAVPQGREHHAGFYDARTGRLVIYGGRNGPTSLADMWALPLGGGGVWTQLPVSGVAAVARHSHSALLDVPNDRLVTVAGASTLTARNDAAACGMSSPYEWTTLVPNDTLPAARVDHAMIYDASRQRLIVWGGDSGEPFLPGALWEWKESPWSTWSELAPLGAAPTARRHAALLLDAARDRALLMGGDDELGAVLGDLWELALGSPPAWNPLSPAGTLPDARTGAALVLDSTRDRLLLFGGRDGAGQVRADLWELPLAGPLQWAPISATGSAPPARWQCVAAYDGGRDQVVLFGGLDSAGVAFGDTWALTLSGGAAWSAVSTSGATPPARYAPSIALDAARDRLLVTGGGGASGSLGDAWSLSLAGVPQWSVLPVSGNSPGARRGATAVFDAAGDRMLLYGGLGEFNHPLGDVWDLRFSGVLDAPDAGRESRVSQLRSPTPNPSRGVTSVRWSLARAGYVRVGLYDVSGRLVRTLVDGESAAGEHAAEWDGRDRQGATVEAGIYFVRLTAPGVRETRKTIRVR